MEYALTLKDFGQGKSPIALPVSRCTPQNMTVPRCLSGHYSDPAQHGVVKQHSIAQQHNVVNQNSMTADPHPYSAFEILLNCLHEDIGGVLNNYLQMEKAEIQRVGVLPNAQRMRLRAWHYYKTLSKLQQPTEATVVDFIIKGQVGITSTVSNAVNGIKNAISNTVSFVSNCVSSVWNGVKGIILEKYEEHIARDGFEKPTHISSTSDSTGTPFAVIQDYYKRKRTIADLKVFGELCDYPSHERMVFFRVINSKLHRTPEIEDKENIYYIDSSDLGERHLGEMVAAVIEKKPRIVFSYSSTLVELGKYILSHKISSENFTMHSVLTGGEGISDENRKMLEKAFGCRVYRRYSDMELGILGQDMGDGSSYLLNWGSYYFECLKVDSDEPAEEGETGRIVVTDLFNKAFPLIRYDTGDLGVLEHKAREFPHLKEIYGRSRDCVYTVDGILISPAKVFVTMWGTEKVKQWQFIQEDWNEYVIKLNCSGPIDEGGIIEKFKTILGYEANIRIIYTDEIPVQASNKRRAVICNYHKS